MTNVTRTMETLDKTAKFGGLIFGVTLSLLAIIGVM